MNGRNSVMALLVAAVGMLTPGQAQADPISVFWSVSQVFGVGVAGAAAAVVSYASYIAVGALVVYGAVDARRRARAARAAYNGSLSDRTVTVLNAAPPMRVVYGRARVGGAIVAMFTSDKISRKTNGGTSTHADALKHLVVVFAAHECHALHEVYVDGAAVGIDNLSPDGWASTGDFASDEHTTIERDLAPGESFTGWWPSSEGGMTVLSCVEAHPAAGDGGQQMGTYTVSDGGRTVTNTSAFTVSVLATINLARGRVRVSWHLGADDQAADAYLMSVAPEWTAAARLRGLSYAVITLDLEEPRFQGGPPGMTFDVSGRKVFDPRLAAPVPEPTTPGLVLLMHFDGDLVDATGLNVATAESTLFGSDGALAGSAVGFSSTAGKVQITASTAIAPMGRDYLIECFVTSVGSISSSENPIFDLIDSDTGQRDIRLQSQADYFTVSRAVDSAGNIGNSNSYAGRAPDTRCHLAVYRVGNILRCAVNGVVYVVSSSATYKSAAERKTLIIGNRSGVAVARVQNRIDEFRMIVGDGLVPYGAANFTPPVVPFLPGAPAVPVDPIQWSDNPALVVRDFLTAEWGYAVSAADVDDDSIAVAANACDTPIAISDGSATVIEALYTCNGSFTTDVGPDRVLDELCQSMAGFAVPGAAWRVQAGTWTLPVLHLTDDDLAGQVEIVQAGAGMGDVFNAMSSLWVPRGEMAESESIYDNSIWVGVDGGELWEDLPLPWTDHKDRARHLQRVFVERSRAGLTARYPAKLKAWPVQVGDRVEVSNAEYGWSAKTFRCTDWAFSVTSAVVLTLQEDAAEIYDQADAATVDPTPNTTLPNPWVLTAPADLNVFSGAAHAQVLADGTITLRALVTWTATTQPYMDGGHVELQWRRVGLDDAELWRQVLADGRADRAALLGDLAPGQTLAVRSRFVNQIGAVSPWVVTAHTVESVVRSVAPPVLAGVVGAVGRIGWGWPASGDAMYAATEVRHEDAGWGGPGALWRGAGTAWTEIAAAAGTVTRYARHFDALGNASSTASASVTVTEANLVAPGTPGAPGVDGAASATLNLSAMVLDVWVDGSGVVTNSAAAAVDLRVTLGGADDTSNWAIAFQPLGVGLGVQRYGDTLVVTHAQPGRATIAIEASRSGYATLRGTVIVYAAETTGASTGFFAACEGAHSVTAYASVVLNSTGLVYKSTDANGGADTYVTTYITPTGPGVGAGIWCRPTLRAPVSGASLSGPAMGGLYNLSTAQEWGLMRTEPVYGPGAADCFIDVELFSNAGGTTLIGTGTIYLKTTVV